MSTSETEFRSERARRHDKSPSLFAAPEEAAPDQGIVLISDAAVRRATIEIVTALANNARDDGPDDYCAAIAFRTNLVEVRRARGLCDHRRELPPPFVEDQPYK